MWWGPTKTIYCWVKVDGVVILVGGGGDTWQVFCVIKLVWTFWTKRWWGAKNYNFHSFSRLLLRSLTRLPTCSLTPLTETLVTSLIIVWFSIFYTVGILSVSSIQKYSHPHPFDLFAPKCRTLMIWKGCQWSGECKKVKGEPRVWLDRGYLEGLNDESRFKIGPLFRKLQTNNVSDNFHSFSCLLLHSLTHSLAHLLAQTTYWDPCNFLNNSLICSFLYCWNPLSLLCPKTQPFIPLWPFCTLM